MVFQLQFCKDFIFFFAKKTFKVINKSRKIAIFTSSDFSLSKIHFYRFSSLPGKDVWSYKYMIIVNLQPVSMLPKIKELLKI